MEARKDRISSNVISDEFLVSKETVVLRRWERSKQKFGFIKRVGVTTEYRTTQGQHMQIG